MGRGACAWGRGGEVVRAACEHFNDIRDADFAERLDGLDDAEFEVEALVCRPFHAAFCFCEHVDGGENAIWRVFVRGLKEGAPEVGGDALAVCGRVELCDQ